MSKTITWMVVLLGNMAPAGCSEPKTLCQWEGYQVQAHEYFKGESKETQAQVLETDLERTRAKNGAVSSGYHAQLGLLYSSIGKDDQMVREFGTGKALFPELATYMDFLLNNVRGGAR